MKRSPPLDRRRFVKLCLSAGALVGTRPSLLRAADAPVRHYERVRLVDADDRPVRVSELNVGENYVFPYPYVTTPCFLIDLGKPVDSRDGLRTEDGRSYHWNGGVGPNRSIVGFSAICAHRMSYPAQQVSFINYRHGKANFFDKDYKPVERSQVIYCCSEKSVYDPAEGARVLGGPAPQPLAAIALEYDPDEDALYATGTHGGEMFDRFFEKFGFRLALDYRTDIENIHRRCEGTTTLLSLAEYCGNQILC
jgi:Rieske Fe-S protein